MVDSSANATTSTPPGIPSDVVLSPPPNTDSVGHEPSVNPTTSTQPPGSIDAPLQGTTAPTEPAAIGQPSPPTHPPQKFEIQLHNPLEPKPEAFEAKVIIPWIVAAIGWAVALFLYRLNRRNKIDDDLNGIVIDDIKEFLEKIEDLTRLVASHQGGCPCQGTDLKESRKHLTTLRQTAMAVSNRVHVALLNDSDKDEWKVSYREWKAATEGNTDWITNKNNKWSRDKMATLEQANEEYTSKIISFRNRIVTRKIKLKA